MARTIAGNMTTSISAAGAFLGHLYEFEFSGGTERFTDIDTDVSWGGNTYTALGGHIGYDAVEESPELRAQGCRVQLDGVETTVDLISHILDENYIGRGAKIYRAHFSSGAVVTDPVLIFDGLMNAPFIVKQQQDKTATITTRLVSNMAGFQQRRGILCDLHVHQHYYSTDTFFRHMAEAPQQGVYWGRRNPQGKPSGQGINDSGGGGGPDPGHDEDGEQLGGRRNRVT